MNWYTILIKCGVRPGVATMWADIFAQVITAETFSAGTGEVDDFLGQVLHESAMLERLEENLHYSPDRLMAVWPTRFPTMGSAMPYARNPRALANHVYGKRLGNVEIDDGWRYRGRGLIQVTGRSNYAAVGRILGVDLVAEPDILARPEMALRSAVAWWEGNIPDALLGDIVRVTRRVNGGTNGLAHRTELTAKAGKALG